MKYKYGVEYPTNGKKPDLPGDVLVSIKELPVWTIPIKTSLAANYIWDRIKSFSIVDERYKPVSENQEKQQNVSVLSESKQKDENVIVDNSWHERGELPPVGWKGEYRPYWHACEVVAYHNGFAVVWDAHDLEYFRTSKPEIFRPIKSQREKFIDAARALARKHHAEISLSLCAALYDAGFRAPE